MSIIANGLLWNNYCYYSNNYWNHYIKKTTTQDGWTERKYLWLAVNFETQIHWISTDMKTQSIFEFDKFRSFTHEPFTINLKYLCRLYGLLLTTCLLLAQFNSRSYKLKTILSNNWVTHSNTAISVQRSWIVFALYIWPAVPFALYIMLNVALAYNLSAAEQVELL